MTDHAVGAALRRQLELLSARMEALEAQAAKADGKTIDLAAVEEGRVDLARAFDALEDDVDAAIEAAFGRAAAALERKLAEG